MTYCSSHYPAGRYSLASMALDTAAVRLLAVLLVAATGGCATIIKGTGRDVVFTSTPSGASIYVEGRFVGKTPIIARVDHGRDKVVVVEQIYVVTLKLHETQGGSLIGTDMLEGASQVEVLRSLRERARQVTTAAFASRPMSR